MSSKNVRQEDIKSSERMEKKEGRKGGDWDMIERSHVGGWQGDDGSSEVGMVRTGAPRHLCSVLIP